MRSLKLQKALKELVRWKVNKVMDSYPSYLGKSKIAYFRAAESISALSDHKCQLGCVVVKNHRIISSGHNSNSRGHGFQKRLDEKFFNDGKSRGCKHAEIDALLPLIRNRCDLTSATIYIFRKNKSNQFAMARPCPRCMSIIREQGIRKIEYTTDLGFASEVLR